MMFVKLIRQELKLKCEKEFQFHPKRKWRFDYYIPELKLAIEVEGGTYKETWYRDKRTGDLTCHKGGRHNTAEGFLADCEKYNSAVILGYKVLRFPPDQLFRVSTLEAIKAIYQRELVK
jgi:very-short-patch-repair endonuclease